MSPKIISLSVTFIIGFDFLDYNFKVLILSSLHPGNKNLWEIKQIIILRGAKNLAYEIVWNIFILKIMI